MTEESLKRFGYTLNVSTSESNEEINLKIILDPETQEILKNYAVKEEIVTEDEGIVFYERYLIKGFISRNLNHNSKVFFSVDLIEKREITLSFSSVSGLQDFLNDLRRALINIFDIHFNLCGERKVKIEVGN